MNGTAETVRLQLIIDQQLAFQPRRARDPVGVPCSLTIEELGNLGSGFKARGRLVAAFAAIYVIWGSTSEAYRERTAESHGN
jgi:hypothetical protein